MSKFKATETPIDGVLVIEPTVYGDKRGFFMESYSERDFLEIGITTPFVDEDHIELPRGVLRGLHFQKNNPQGKLIRVVSGSILAVAVDLRPEKESYGASHSVELSAENKRMFWIPPQFASGFLTLDSNTEIICKYSVPNETESETGIIWSDPILAIDWQFERYNIDEKYLNISLTDKKLPIFRSWNPKTLW